MTDLRVTTLIAWRDRPELARTLRHNAPFLDAMHSDVIVLNSGGDSHALRQLRDSAAVPTRQIDLPGDGFNKSFALNVGIHEARPGVIFVLDADILLTCCLTAYAEQCARQDCFAIACGTSEIPPLPLILDLPPGSMLKKVVFMHSFVFHWADGAVTEVVQHRHDCASRRMIKPGVMLARKEHLVDVGGYRSEFVGWGWEDLDIQVRLMRRGLECVYFEDEIKHLEHGDDKRDLPGPKAEVQRANRNRAWQAYAAGRLVGTYAADVDAWRSARPRAALP